MKTILLKNSVESFYLLKSLSLRSDWCEVNLKPINGEWVVYQYQQENYIGFVNLMANSFYLVEKIENSKLKEYLQANENEIASLAIKKLLEKAIKYRLEILPYGRNARLVFGISDYLPGLIVDGYENMVLVQINTAGIDRFREIILNTISSLIPNVKIIFLDNAAQRNREALPVYNNDPLPETNLIIHEGRMQLHISAGQWQKNGYYYDHRDNRERFYRKLTELKLTLDNGLDLFCYLGSWGITALMAGVKKFDFVDQATLGEQLDVNLRINHLEGRGNFHRQDAFSFLDEKIQMKKSYDVIISDPPSFAKSADKKLQAIQGYKKLHKKILNIAKSGTLICFASCTHYVSKEEFESTILESAKINKRSLKLIDIGIQALDHPFVNFNDKSYYLKYFAYLVE